MRDVAEGRFHRPRLVQYVPAFRGASTDATLPGGRHRGGEVGRRLHRADGLPRGARGAPPGAERKRSGPPGRPVDDGAGRRRLPWRVRPAGCPAFILPARPGGVAISGCPQRARLAFSLRVERSREARSAAGGPVEGLICRTRATFSTGAGRRRALPQGRRAAGRSEGWYMRLANQKRASDFDSVREAVADPSTRRIQGRYVHSGS